MSAARTPHSGARRLLSILLVAVWLLAGLPPGAGAKEVTPEATVPAAEVTPEATAEPPVESELPAAEPTTLPLPEPTLEPTLPPAPEPTIAPTEPPAPTAAPTEAPAEPTTDASAGPPAATATVTDIATATSLPGLEPAAIRDEATGIRVTVLVGDFFGPPVAGVCMTLTHSYLGVWQDNGCTDASGQVLLHPWMYDRAGVTPMRVDFYTPRGYEDIEFIGVNAIAGQISEYKVAVQPAPPTTATFRAVRNGTDTPLGGVCWTLFENRNLFPGDLVAGPNCDDDGDGTVVFADLAYGSTCYVPTPPDGFLAVGGGDAVCAEAAVRDRVVTRAFAPVGEVLSGTGKVILTVVDPQERPIAGACALLRLTPAGRDPIDVTTACAGADGVVTFESLGQGTYALVSYTLPEIFLPFPDVPIDVNREELTFRVTAKTAWRQSGAASLTATIGYGPAPLPGVCWTYEPAVDGKPSGAALIGPVCDDNGDGFVSVGIVAGPYCLVAHPPAGWWRPDGDLSLCLDPFFGSASWTVGFVPTGEALPTPSPSPTPTPLPTVPPAPDEPTGSLTVQNCAYTALDEGFRFFDLCTPAGAGVRLALVQDGKQVAVLTTDTGGRIPFTLPARAVYGLRYLDGNAAGWVVGPGEEARLRYGSADAFSFVPAAMVDTWTMTVRTISLASWNSGTPIGGACYRIVDADGNELLPAVCDDDGDGVTSVGQLPASRDFTGSTPYRAEMTSPPPGYAPLTYLGFGRVTAADPGTWSAQFAYTPITLRIRAVDEGGNPLLGWCYDVSQASQVCDGSGYDGTAADGEVVLYGISTGGRRTITAVNATAGYRPVVASQTVTIGSDPEQVVTFVGRPYGGRADRTDLRIVLSFDQTGQDAKLQGRFADACFTLSPNVGTPSGESCADTAGRLLIAAVPAGTYTLFTRERFAVAPGCRMPGSLEVTVGAADLGGVVEVPVVLTCTTVPTNTRCNVLRMPVERSVDIYAGALTDPETGETLVDGLQLSEAIPFFLADDLLRRDNAAFDLLTAANLTPWVLDGASGSVGNGWTTSPDWDANARQRLLDQFAAAGLRFVPSERVTLASEPFWTDSGFDLLVVAPWGADLADYPECPAGTKYIDVQYMYLTTVNLYRLDATLAPPVTDPGELPTPGPALCTNETTREVTAFYGTVIDPTTGRVVARGLALSDKVPPGIRAAIERGDPPEVVAALIAEWEDENASDIDWGNAPAEGLDAEAALRAQLGAAGSDVRFAEADDQGTEDFSVTTTVYVDESDLPEGCVVASWARLIPIDTTTTARIRFVRLDATLGAPVTVSPTPTESPRPDATPTPGTTPAATEVAAQEPVTRLPVTGARDGGGSSPVLLLGLLLAALAMGGASLRARQRGA